MLQICAFTSQPAVPAYPRLWGRSFTLLPFIPTVSKPQITAPPWAVSRQEAIKNQCWEISSITFHFKCILQMKIGIYHDEEEPDVLHWQSVMSHWQTSSYPAVPSPCSDEICMVVLALIIARWITLAFASIQQLIYFVYLQYHSHLSSVWTVAHTRNGPAVSLWTIFCYYCNDWHCSWQNASKQCKLKCSRNSTPFKKSEIFLRRVYGMMCAIYLGKHMRSAGFFFSEPT